MNLRVRRVVTGHDPQGKAIVTSDETLPVTTRRPGQEGYTVWSTNGAVFRIVRYEAGTAGRMHRTDTLDYGVILNGSIVLELDEGRQVTFHAGDVLVQRGTIHNWINRGAEACTIAFVLIDAPPP